MMKKVLKGMVYFLIVVMLFLILFPLFFIVSGTIKGENEIIQSIGSVFHLGKDYVQWSIFPKYPNIWSYMKVLFDTPGFYMAFWNTIKIAVATLILQGMIGITASWAISTYKFKHKNLMIKFYIVLLILPFQVLMLPQYLILHHLNLLNTIWSIILPMAVSPQFMLITFFFFSKIDSDIVDSARLDGAGEFMIFRKIGIPIAWPGIMIASLLSVVESFNLIEQPLLFIEDKTKWTLALYLPNVFQGGVGENFVISLFTILPVGLVYLYVQYSMSSDY